jgi:hypothetical protein
MNIMETKRPTSELKIGCLPRHSFLAKAGSAFRISRSARAKRALIKPNSSRLARSPPFGRARPVARSTKNRARPSKRVSSQFLDAGANF